MKLWIEIVMMVAVISVASNFILTPTSHATPILSAKPSKTYSFTNCHQNVDRNNIFYYCYGNPPHSRTILYFELENP